MREFPPGAASGDFRHWLDAAALCSFDRPEFVEQVCAAALAMTQGAAVHMRDGQVFDEIEYSWPLLAGLMFAAARHGGALTVLDFGGSLGTTYLQNRRLLDRLAEVEWHIVEKEAYCAFGETRLPHPRIRYHRSIEACLAAGASPNAALFSSVLQFLPDPWAVLARTAALPIRHVLIDRCPISEEGRDRLTVFRAPASVIENMTRPMWFFEEARLLAALGPDFALVERFPGFESDPNIPSRYSGYILERIG